MKTKEKDVLYCGVRKNKIESASPTFNEKNVRYLYDWISERYSIHLKKDVKKEKSPWTNNKILKDYRFTNVRREHDRQTINLIKKVTNNSSLSLEEKILNSIIFRTWNREDTFSFFCGPFEIDDFKGETFKTFLSLARRMYKAYSQQDPNHVYWTPVFNTGGLKSAWFSPRTNCYIGATVKNLKVKYSYKGKEEEVPYRKFRELVKEVDQNDLELLDFVGVSPLNQSYTMWEKDVPLRVFWLAKWVVDNNIISRILEAKDQKEVVDILQEIPGIAYFLSYQIFVDFSYIPEFPFSENEFTAAGPGCKKGLDFIFRDRDGMTYEECLFWIRDNQRELFHEYEYDPNDLFNDLPEEDRILNVMSLENCMCEISKYIKAIEGKGRPRNKYSSPAKHSFSLIQEKSF